MEVKCESVEFECTSEEQYRFSVPIDPFKSAEDYNSIKQESALNTYSTFEDCSVDTTNIEIETHTRSDISENLFNEIIAPENAEEPIPGCSYSEMITSNQVPLENESTANMGTTKPHNNFYYVQKFVKHNNFFKHNDASFLKNNEIYFYTHGIKSEIPESINEKKEALIQLDRLVTYERNFACHLCSDFFPSLDILNDHKFFIHDVIYSTASDVREFLEKPFVCNECDYRCKRSTDLKRHKLVHTDSKPFKCNLCDYKCKQIMYLKHHQMIHSSEKTFHCDLCDFKCKTSSNLKTHKTIHSGERPYECDLCDLKFAQSSTLKTHKMVHSGEKPFKCDMCEYKCTTSGTLKRHKTIHITELKVQLIK